MRIVSGRKEILENFPQILNDESQFKSGIPQKICFPQSQSDLSNILEDAYSKNIPVTFIGGQTGTTGGAVPVQDCIAICFSHMNRINCVKKENLNTVLYCDPGVTLSSINSFLSSPSKWPYQVSGVELLNYQKFMYPPDPTETTAQLGGTVATNASGARSFRFGPTRAFVNYLECVLATGEKIQISRGHFTCKKDGFSILTDHKKFLTIPAPTFISPSVKNASGYYCSENMDLIDLIIGSEGTLAAVSQIGICLKPSVQIISGMSFFDNRHKAFDFADFLRKDPQVLSIEFYDENCLTLVTKHRDRIPVKVPSYPDRKSTALFWEFMENQPDPFESRTELWERELNYCGSSFDHTWSGLESGELKRLRAFRHAVPELINAIISSNRINFPSIRKIGTDTAVPGTVFRNVYSEYLEVIEKSSLKYVSFGHLGDYHLHINLIPYSDSQMTSALDVYDEIMEITVKNKGTISAEHGIGKIKKQYFQKMYSSETITQMHAIKNTFDPKGILNCGNLL